MSIICFIIVLLSVLQHEYNIICGNVEMNFLSFSQRYRFSERYLVIIYYRNKVVEI
jgi:hypothetical protein